MDDFTDVIGALTGLSAIVMGIGLAFWSVYWSHRKRQLQYEERRVMIERGMTPPPDLPHDKIRITPQDCLRRGVVLLSLGAGFALGAVVLANFSSQQQLVWVAGVAAAIVGCLGAGNLAYYVIARQKPEEAAPL